ncbi:MAG: sialate O-acetylesterase [Verrucomicrobia bacterium]|nr:sialate O-acetylesterase [Verrucomicrobiota bacterium]
MRRVFLLCLLALSSPLFAQKAAKAKKANTPRPTNPPLVSVDITKLPEGTTHLDLWLLCGQSNMKGRGFMPEEPHNDPRIVMMHKMDDQWYLARHPLHLTGDAKTFQGHDNAGVGPGLAFAEVLAAQDKTVAIGIVPCAVGGSSIKLWQKGAKLYEEAIRRAKLALQTTAPVKARLRGVIWLQGEANANPQELPLHAERLRMMIEALRADLALPELPFIACTIGEMKPEPQLTNLKAMNEIQLALPKSMPHTACVDARDLKTHIGDSVHFDTAAQNEIGKRFAAKAIQIVKP